VGKAGCVMSLPGCCDQTIHADTAHIFTHQQLPPHYCNLFIPTQPSDDKAIGQTAFILGSHDLKTSTRVMVEEDGQVSNDQSTLPFIYDFIFLIIRLFNTSPN
jgi:hypothetical protein